MTIMPKNESKDNALTKICEQFIKRYKINQLLRNARATKEKGIPAYSIFAMLLGLVFTGKNLYTLLDTHKGTITFGKDAVYRLLNRASVNWELFLLSLSNKVVAETDKLTSTERRAALIIDDSPYYRNRSKKVELLSRCFDHVTHKYFKGFNILTLGWSDGQTFLPVNFRLVASGNDKNLLEGSHVKEDRRTLATRRRTDARKSKPVLVLEMLKSIIGKAAQTNHVLFDSWFSSPSLILSVEKLGYHVVARLKNHENYCYNYQGKNLSISKIYGANRKRRGRSRYLLSVNVAVRHDDFPSEIPAKIVFVRDKNNRKKWIALISTDVGLSEDEIASLYGIRWDIEPFHKVIKSYLRLENEFQFRSYDAMTAHATIVMTRYIFLSIGNRESKDNKSVCAVFNDTCKKLEDISFSHAFDLVVDAFAQSASDLLCLNKNKLLSLVDHFFNLLPPFIKDKLAFSVCES